MKQFWRRKKKNRNVFISVIIPAHNEEKLLPDTLNALRRQSHPRFESIVVANGCADATAEIAPALCDQFYNLESRGLGPARNLGAQKARGDLLLFLDADTVLEPDALELIARKFTRRFSAGTLKGEPDSPRLSYKLIYLLKNFIHQSHAHHGSSGVILCWKDHFQKVGGFDNDLYLRENSDLMKKLRRFGRYRYINATPAVTSMRRYEKTGVSEMILLWVRVWFLSNFSDIRNQTYEEMSTRPAMSSRLAQWIWDRIEKKRKALRARRASMSC
jgi:glycosyltransferase involved in cell wall biosynthesis